MNAMTETRPGATTEMRPGAATLSPTLASMLALRLPVEVPAWLDPVSAWTTHLPFACWLVAATRPRAVAELGVHVGVSFCTFAEEMARQGIEGTCLGVDTFSGDAHAGRYDGSVLDRLRAHHDPRYGRFSRLLPATFDQALAEVPDGSLDLLHIDGLHTYEAVRHDYESWAPKLSPRGVVLFHDTEERRADFGVWRFWAEVSAGRPHFGFLHGHGLGVLGGTEVPSALAPLFEAGPAEAAQIRAVFSALGQSCLAATPKPPKPRKRRFWPWR
jgi:hypothetical protein